MTLYTKRALIIIPADQVAAATAIAKQLDPEGGEQTFNVPLVNPANPDAPPTHYWCSWALTEKEHQQLQTQLATLGRPKLYDGLIVKADQALSLNRLARTVEAPVRIDQPDTRKEITGGTTRI